jgi:DNA polymerase elongation subunit (family B)
MEALEAEKDIDKMSIEELEALENKYNVLQNMYTAYEQAVKLSLNSIYGAFGNKWFHFFNIQMAESITLQGQNAILYSESILNKYFTEFWHKDEKLHDHLGIKVKNKLVKPAVIYIDTDSNYVQFGEMYDSIEWLDESKKMDVTTFTLEVYNIRIKNYIAMAMEKYAKMRNTDNFLVFELESVAYSGIFMTKKKYIQDIAWEDKLATTDRHPSLKKIKTIGYDTIQSSTPVFARKKLTEALSLLFSKGVIPGANELQEIVNFMKDCKKEFKLVDIDDICFNRKTNNIHKYIIDDNEEFQIGHKCPPNVKAAGFYNYIMNNNPKYKNKYKMIANGEKLRIYNTKHPVCDIFAYLPGEHPYEIAPEIDYDTQFEKCMIDPINRVLRATGLQELDTNLIYASALF